MKKVTPTELSNNIDRLLDEILETGIPLEINKNGKLISTSLVPLNESSFITYLSNGIVPFAHGSVIIRKSFLLKNNLKYGPNKFSEDYCLWVQIYNNNGIFINFDDNVLQNGQGYPSIIRLSSSLSLLFTRYPYLYESL
jgi:hypothetical protein